ncbi:hypothetical protein [Paracoccus sp. MC1862]|uniref:phage tail assembly chaperone n=1 Tax=Paracoccus sp. MC1862 TaxID=2760307 RepID=UPI00160399DB|nr:hypothetical protein [Paracoccus sp. MC1862]MBB1498459.1 hypothetical protein [Paracoccus sp. MC1862]QQO43811.1 hypothetical protein JGR78_10255 [Paracoccus sp. MC1862]
MDRLQNQLCAAVKAALAGGKVRPPEAGIELWKAFQRLSATRTYHPAGPNPIQPSEIAAWCQLMRMPLEPRHVEIILAMDGAWLDQAYARDRTPDGVKTLPPISQQPLTVALLDAVMG